MCFLPGVFFHNMTKIWALLLKCNFYTAPIFSVFKKVTAIISIITLKMTMMTVFEPLLRRSQIIAQTLWYLTVNFTGGRGEEGDRPDPAVTSNHATKHTLFFSSVFVFVLALQWVEVYHYALLLYIIPMYITYHVHNDLLCILMQCTSTELVRFGFGILSWFEVNFLAMPCIMHC